MRDKRRWRARGHSELSGPPLVHIKREPDQWILPEIAHHLALHLGWSVGKTSSQTAAVNYFVNYHRWEETDGLSAAFFTHHEPWYPRYDRLWWQVLDSVDLAVFQSTKYQNEALAKMPNLRSVVIGPGFDPKKFRPQPLRIGVVGRSYNNGRKGEDLLAQVIPRFPQVDWVVTGGNWGVPSKRVKGNKLPSLYRSLDYLLIPSRTEGGPMSALEALASGVPVVSADVGWMSELPHISFSSGSLESLTSVITKLLEQRNSLTNSVANRTWPLFAELHRIAFTQLMEEKHR